MDGADFALSPWLYESAKESHSNLLYFPEFERTPTMTDTTPRKPGRPRKASPVQEQPTQPVQQFNVARLTAHMLAGEIHRLHEEGEDLTPVHQVSDAIRAVNVPVTGLIIDPTASAEPSTPNVEPHEVDALKAAVEAVKTSADRPRTFAVAFHNKRGRLKVAHGVEYEDGDIDIHDSQGFGASYADDMAELHEIATKRHGNAYHVDYTD